MSTYKFWKHAERKVAKLFGLERNPEKGVAAQDVKPSWLAIEVKSTTGEHPQWIKDAIRQSATNAKAGQLPIVVLVERRGEVLVVLRAQDFVQWFGEGTK